MFGAAKGAKPLPVVDDALSQAFSNSGQRFQFICRGSVDIDELIGSLKRSRLLSVRLFLSCLIRLVVIIAG